MDSAIPLLQGVDQILKEGGGVGVGLALPASDATEQRGDGKPSPYGAVDRRIRGGSRTWQVQTLAIKLEGNS
jgi:hypothetical protein